MIEKIVVFAVVGIAAWYVTRRIMRQSRGRGCGDCNCAAEGRKAETLVRIKNIDDDCK